MGYIKEPDGVDFFVDSKPLTDKDRKEISEIIANYKSTGQKTKVENYSRDLGAKKRSEVKNLI